MAGDVRYGARFFFCYLVFAKVYIYGLYTYIMQLVAENERIGTRSTGRLSARKLSPVIRMLETSAVIRDHDRRRRDGAGRKLKFSTLELVVLLFYMEVKQLTFDGLRELLEGRGGQRILANLGMHRGPDGRYALPSDGWLSEFRNHEYPLIRLELEREIRDSVLERYRGERKVITVDSTPLEGSRYSPWAYNPHYEIRMAKAHMVMVNGIPVISSFTDGNGYDNNEFLALLDRFDGARIRDARFVSDGGYCSRETYLKTFLRTGCLMSSNIRSDASIHKDALWGNVLRRYGRLYREHGFVPTAWTTPGFIINFLAEHGEGKLAGWALRNLDVMRPDAVHREDARARHVCETVHHAMKRWVSFDVRGLWRKYAEVRNYFRILVCTLLCILFKAYDC